MREIEFTAGGNGSSLGTGTRASQIEFTACGPTRKLTREAVREVILVYAGSIGFRILVKIWTRIQAREGADSVTSVLLAAGAALAVAIAAVGFMRTRQRNDYWTLFLAGCLSFAALFRFEKANLGAGTFLEVPLVLAPLVPAAIAIWAFVSMVREADELQRRILYQALALGFVVTFIATSVWALLEDLGLPHVSSVWWLMVLAISWCIGLAIYSRRYR